MAKRQYGNKISNRDSALTGASSPPGALIDSTCLHAVDCVGTFIWALQPLKSTLSWIVSFGWSCGCKRDSGCDTLWRWGKRWIAECVRLSLIDTDPHPEFPWGAGKGRWCLRSYEESVVFYPANLSRSLSPSTALGPGTEDCQWKVMEIRWNVVLLRR